MDLRIAHVGASPFDVRVVIPRQCSAFVQEPVAAPALFRLLRQQDARARVPVHAGRHHVLWVPLRVGASLTSADRAKLSAVPSSPRVRSIIKNIRALTSIFCCSDQCELKPPSDATLTQHIGIPQFTVHSTLLLCLGSYLSIYKYRLGSDIDIRKNAATQTRCLSVPCPVVRRGSQRPCCACMRCTGV